MQIPGVIMTVDSKSCMNKLADDGRDLLHAGTYTGTVHAGTHTGIYKGTTETLAIASHQCWCGFELRVPHGVYLSNPLVSECRHIAVCTMSCKWKKIERGGDARHERR
jgi:hypothetical protein